MSQQLISLSPDLKQLRQDGYDIQIRAGYLLVQAVPYVNSNRDVRRGTLVMPLGDVSGDHVRPPGDHTTYFIGEHPCKADGSTLSAIANNSDKQKLARTITVDHYFSAKPKSGSYRDFYHKVTTYVSHISNPAREIDPSATAQTCQLVEAPQDDSPFNYLDTNTTRAGIGAANAKLEGKKIAIVGLGGTGSYILDLVAKTPVAEIHLFEGDAFSNHNAFRSPGAPSLQELRDTPLKVIYFRDRYLKMHRGVIAHEDFIDEKNVTDLRGMDFVFLCIDRGDDKKLIVDKLTEWGLLFIDVGIGVDWTGDKLRGQVRTTTSTAQKRDHLGRRISFSDDRAENDYSTNIQIAELNALNAALAVIKWKKLCGFYQDADQEHCSIYTIDGNWIANEDKA